MADTAPAAAAHAWPEPAAAPVAATSSDSSSNNNASSDGAPSDDGETCRLLVEDYYCRAEIEAAAKAAAGKDSSSSSTAGSSIASALASDPYAVTLTVSLADRVVDVVRKYRRHWRAQPQPSRFGLIDPVCFLAHPLDSHGAGTPVRPAAATAASAVTPVAAGAAPRVESGASLLQHVRGKRVQLSSTEVTSCTLASLCVRPGSVLTLRARPFPVRVEIDNSVLEKAGVPADQLQRDSIVLWVEERSSVAQLREEYVRQAREDGTILGGDRHRFFIAPISAADEAALDACSLSARKHKVSTLSIPAKVDEITHPIDAMATTLLRSLPLGPHSTLWVRKDPTRWLHEAIKRNDESLVERLIIAGADAHLLDAQGFSAFFHAQQLASNAAAKASQALREAAVAAWGQDPQFDGERDAARVASYPVDIRLYQSMVRLLLRYFPPSPLECEAVRRLQEQYAGFLHAKACVRKQSAEWITVGKGGGGELKITEDYAYVYCPKASGKTSVAPGAPAGPIDEANPLRVVTSERHKPIGVINLRRESTAASAVAPLHGELMHALTPPLANSDSAPVSYSTQPVERFWGEFDRTPSVRLFSVAVTQGDKPSPILLAIRSPPYPFPSGAKDPPCHSLTSVNKVRVLVTWVDTFKAMYMVNIKLTMLLFSAAAATHSFFFGDPGGGPTSGFDTSTELAAQFGLTLAKALFAFGFLVRIVRPRRTFSFPAIKSFLLVHGRELAYAETWGYFLGMELVDAGIIVCNVRVLAALTGAGVSLGVSDLSPGAPPLSPAQSTALSITLSLVSLVAVNLVSIIVSLAADESKDWSLKKQRYIYLHLPVLLTCFASLRISFDFREMAVSSGAGQDDGILSYLTPATMAFIFSYLGGMSLKTLQLVFCPPTRSHGEMDRLLGEQAIATDMKASAVYVILAMVVYGAANQPETDRDRDMLSAHRSSTTLFDVALSIYFASALVLLLTAVFPFALRIVEKRVDWGGNHIRIAWLRLRGLEDEEESPAVSATGATGAPAVGTVAQEVQIKEQKAQEKLKKEVAGKMVDAIVNESQQLQPLLTSHAAASDADSPAQPVPATAPQAKRAE